MGCWVMLCFDTIPLFFLALIDGCKYLIIEYVSLYDGTSQE